METFITQNVSVVELDKVLSIPESAYNDETKNITKNNCIFPDKTRQSITEMETNCKVNL